MEYAFKFESPEDFNARESRKLNLHNLETRRALVKAAANTLYSAVTQEAQAVKRYAIQKSQNKDVSVDLDLTHYIEWGRKKNEFIPDDTVSCKLAQQKNKDGMGEGIIYEILFPLNGSVITADDLLENFESLVRINEFYIVKTNTDDPYSSSYYYINELGIAEHQPFGTVEQEIDIELAVFMEEKERMSLPILTATKEMELWVDLIKMKLVPYKISSL
jgi:hypothetical protein